MVKTYILDTNVLIQDPDSIFKFEENEVVIPDVVIEELDKLKTKYGDIGYNARQSIRNIENLRQTGDIFKGVQLPSHSSEITKAGAPAKRLKYGKFRIETDCKDVIMPSDWDLTKPDNNIIRIAKGLKEQNPENVVILVSKDAIVRIKASIVKVESQDYQNERIADEFLDYMGRDTLELADEDYARLEKFYKSGEMVVTDEEKEKYHFIENEFVMVQCGTATKLGRYTDGKIVGLIHENDHPMDINPLNAGQKFALEALLAPAEEVPLVILKGPAGTAKTFLTLAAGLEQAMNMKDPSYRKKPACKEASVYRKLLITRANVQFDADIGALPGDELDKINPLMRGCLDNIEKLIDNETVKNCANQRAEEELNDKVQSLFDMGYIKMEALGYLRGRSIDNHYLLIDEAQNTSPNQMLGILTRAGEGTKIVLCGDLEQIDNTKLDRHTNGLASALKFMRGSKYCAILGFNPEETTRSILSKEVANRWRLDNKELESLNS